ncbi:DUF4013 domain-containing protein [Sphaerobacter thermophilus]|uniref:DUF4013 domain-containing protein n=1 Tax=Sphaerobacter thermophilus TaxID=2057 RepID=UPI000DB38CE7|nr:MAG: hypothetical protein DIU58_09380 [Sphaerobacter thermophilus]
MDIGRAFTFTFQDSQWIKKVAIGGLLVLIPIIGWLFVSGYWLRLVRQVVENEDVPLPEWNDFGGDLVRGLKFIVVAFVWSIPAAIVSLMASFSGNGNDLSSTNLGLQCLSTILSLGAAFVQPLFATRVALTEDIGAGLQFGAIFNEIRPVATSLLIVLLMSIVIALLAMVGVVLCIIGVIFTVFFAYVVQAHLYGQVRRQLQGDPTAAIRPLA